MIKVLITSISKKVPLIKSVRDACSRFDREYQIIGGDSDSTCIGRYFVDQFWKMPSFDQLTIDDLIAYCTNEGVKYVIPTRDGELPFFALFDEQLSKSGIHVMVSGLEGVETALDKYRFFKKCVEQGVPAIPTTLSVEEIEAHSYVVKERYGSGSRQVGCRLTFEEAKHFSEQLNVPVYQPFIEGDEISVDLYLSNKGQCLGVICRERNRVVGGESQVTTTFRDRKLERLCSQIAKSLHLRGHVMFQLIHESLSGNVYLLECNPRFGGASGVSVKAGLDSFYWFLCESSGTVAPIFKRSANEITMVRYAEDLFLI